MTPDQLKIQLDIRIYSDDPFVDFSDNNISELFYWLKAVNNRPNKNYDDFLDIIVLTRALKEKFSYMIGIMRP